MTSMCLGSHPSCARGRALVVVNIACRALVVVNIACREHC